MYESEEARKKSERGGELREGRAVSDAGGLTPRLILGAPRSKFKIAVSVTDFGIQCTHKVHRIMAHGRFLWKFKAFGCALWCGKYGILAAPYYKPQCSRPGEKVAAYSPEFTVIRWVFLSTPSNKLKLNLFLLWMTVPHSWQAPHIDSFSSTSVWGLVYEQLHSLQRTLCSSFYWLHWVKSIQLMLIQI